MRVSRALRKRITGLLLGCAVVSSMLAGCGLSPLAKHATLFSAATASVIDNSEDAYRAANALREREQMVSASYAYDSDPHWNPYKDFKPLLTPDQLQARIQVLDGLKAYADSLVTMTGKASKEDEEALENAAGGVGQNLQSLSSTVNTKFEAAIPAVSGTEANVVSTAVLALGQYLQNRKIKNSLPKVTQDMDPHVKTVCELLKSDVAVMRRQADVDYTSLINRQNEFIVDNGSKLDPLERRGQVEGMIRVAYQQKANDELLSKLQDAIVKLQLTHHALAAAAQGNNPEGLKDKIAELSAAGKNLANYYKTLSTPL